ncbi:HAD-IA family hydrolase [Candidatus Saccharibacteria bacterium]|nr:HAD-IA family hydrolase [Candidatus Saccharibacteria bacterium]
MGGEKAEVELGKRLQIARQKAGLTQQEMCQKAGLSYSTLAKIERGAIKSPSIFTIQNIATTLGISINELLGLESTNSVSDKKTSKSGVKFVYFDINGCLVRFFHRAFGKLSFDSGVQADLIETTFWHYNDAVCRGELSMSEFNKLFANKLHMPNMDWMDYYLEAIDPIDDMKDLVIWVSKNYGVGLLSNIMPGFIDKMLELKLLPDAKYDSIVDSSVVGAIKPEQKIYEIAQEQSGNMPSEILLVDDSRSNLMAAEKMGWHVLWFDDYRPEESSEKIKTALEFI